MNISGLSTGALIGIGILAVLSLALMLVAVLRLVTTPKERLTLPLLAWLLIILLVNPLGALAFLILGRRPVRVENPPLAAGQDAVPQALDLLYGQRPVPRGGRP